MFPSRNSPAIFSSQAADISGHKTRIGPAHSWNLVKYLASKDPATLMSLSGYNFSPQVRVSWETCCPCTTKYKILLF